MSTTFEGRAKCERCQRIFELAVTDAPLLNIDAADERSSPDREVPGTAAKQVYYREVMTQVAAAMLAVERHICPGSPPK